MDNANEDARLERLREQAERALERAGRRELPESQVRKADYDLSQAPAPIQALARSVEAMPIEEVRAECLKQFPTDGIHGPGFPESIEWTEEEDRRAKNKLVGYAAGLALGVTKLEREPLSDVIRAATKIGIDLASKQAAARRAERLGLNAQAKRQLALRAKARRAKESRKRNRGKA